MKVLSIAIGFYLALIYGVLLNSNTIVTILTGILKEKETETNGHLKINNGIKNGHKPHAF